MTKKTLERNDYLHTTGIASMLGLIIFVCLVSSAQAASSENYVLDSAVIGNTGTIEASSENFKTGNTAQPVFYNGETINNGGGGGNTGGGGGRHLSVKPKDTQSYIYTETVPLVLKNFQSGTLAGEFTNPHEFITLYVSPFASQPKGTTPESTTTFSLIHIPLTVDNTPTGFNAKDILGGRMYQVSALTDGAPLEILRKYLTLIIESPELAKATDTTRAVYFFHPIYKAWVKMPYPAFIDGATIFQTPYVTRYFILDTTVHTSAPAIIRTKETPSTIDDATIITDVQKTNERARENGKQEGEVRTPPPPDMATPEPIPEPVIVSRSIPESFIDYLREKYAEYTLLVLGIPLVITLLLLVVLSIIVRRGK